MNTRKTSIGLAHKAITPPQNPLLHLRTIVAVVSEEGGAHHHVKISTKTWVMNKDQSLLYLCSAARAEITPHHTHTHTHTHTRRTKARPSNRWPRGRIWSWEPGWYVPLPA